MDCTKVNDSAERGGHYQHKTKEKLKEIPIKVTHILSIFSIFHNK